jgi:carbonic anhydrase/acetyltransferase-like protein (isoleucine patch superfamily)
LFHTVLRADVNKVSIGENSNIQDLCCLHVSHEYALEIGNNVTVGHQVTLHGCRIGDHSLIGMGATIMDGVEVGENSLVAAGALIPPGKKFPPYSFIVGSPAILKRQLSPEEREYYAKFYLHYQRFYGKYFLLDILKL